MITVDADDDVLAREWGDFVQLTFGGLGAIGQVGLGIVPAGAAPKLSLYAPESP